MPSPTTLQPPAEPLLAQLVQHYDELVGFLRHRFGDECQPREIVNELCLRLMERPVPQGIANPLAFLRHLARCLEGIAANRPSVTGAHGLRVLGAIYPA